MNLTEFLTARLDEDEAMAKAAPGNAWQAFGEADVAGAAVYDEQWVLLNPVRYDHDNALSSKPGATGPQYIQRSRDELCAHIARHDPARVLRDVAAKRAILAECARSIECGDDGRVLAEAVIVNMAGAWGDHPDYAEAMQFA